MARGGKGERGAILKGSLICMLRLAAVFACLLLRQSCTSLVTAPAPRQPARPPTTTNSTHSRHTRARSLCPPSPLPRVQALLEGLSGPFPALSLQAAISVVQNLFVHSGDSMAVQALGSEVGGPVGAFVKFCGVALVSQTAPLVLGLPGGGFGVCGERGWVGWWAVWSMTQHTPACLRVFWSLLC